MKNEKGKTRPVNDPYEVYVSGTWEWRVLKHYQSPDKEAENPYARVFCAVKSPATSGGYDLGDTYLTDIPLHAKLSAGEMADHFSTKGSQW